MTEVVDVVIEMSVECRFSPASIDCNGLTHGERMMTFREFAEQNECIWLTPKQVAKLMQCSLEHVYELAKSGRIAYIKDGKNVRFKPEDLDEYEQNKYVRRERGFI